MREDLNNIETERIFNIVKVLRNTVDIEDDEQVKTTIKYLLEHEKWEEEDDIDWIENEYEVW